MTVSNISSIFLGLTEKSDTTKTGESFDYRRVSFVVVGEEKSRDVYLDASDKCLSVFRGLSWGDKILIDGDLAANGKLTLESVEKADDGSFDAFSA